MTLRLIQKEIGPMDNFQYLLKDDVSGRFWMVDPAWEAEAFHDQAVDSGGILAGILVTHAHFDHTNAIEQILRRGDVPIYLQKKEFDFLDKNAPKELFPDIPRSTLKLVSHGDTLDLGGSRLTFVHTPGHTLGSQCFLIEGNLVSGDTLFLNTCGRVDLPGSDPRAMFDTINGTLARFPDETVVYPGHNYSRKATRASMADVKTANRFFTAETLGRFLEMVGY
jgi:glyoxylase-like metal-dependent hydrolase (beta-lactamase superfamily II)